MKQESDQSETSNIVPFSEVLRRRPSPQRIDRTTAQPSLAPEDDEPSPPAAA